MLNLAQFLQYVNECLRQIKLSQILQTYLTILGTETFKALFFPLWCFSTSWKLKFWEKNLKKIFFCYFWPTELFFWKKKIYDIFCLSLFLTYRIIVFFLYLVVDISNLAGWFGILWCYRKKFKMKKETDRSKFLLNILDLRIWEFLVSVLPVIVAFESIW